MNNQDELERWILYNRKSLDQIEDLDHEALWNNIRPGKKAKQSRWILQVAAAAIVILCGFFAWYTSKPAPAIIAQHTQFPLDASFVKAYEKQFQQPLTASELSRVDHGVLQDINSEWEEVNRLTIQTTSDQMDENTRNKILELIRKNNEIQIKLLELLQRELQKPERNEIPNEIY